MLAGLTLPSGFGERFRIFSGSLSAEMPGPDSRNIDLGSSLVRPRRRSPPLNTVIATLIPRLGELFDRIAQHRFLNHLVEFRRGGRLFSRLVAFRTRRECWRSKPSPLAAGSTRMPRVLPSSELQATRAVRRFMAIVSFSPPLSIFAQNSTPQIVHKSNKEAAALSRPSRCSPPESGTNGCRERYPRKFPNTRPLFSSAVRNSCDIFRQELGELVGASWLFRLQGPCRGAFPIRSISFVDAGVSVRSGLMFGPVQTQLETRNQRLDHQVG